MSLNNFGIVSVKNKAVLSRSAQPDAEGITTLTNIGTTVILKLNSSHEYPLKNESLLAPQMIVRETALDSFNPSEDAARELARQIEEYVNSGVSVHVHCTHGRDRTGLIIGAWQLLYGNYSYQQVMSLRKCYGVTWIMDIPDHEIIEMLQKFAKEKNKL